MTVTPIPLNEQALMALYDQAALHSDAARRAALVGAFGGFGDEVWQVTLGDAERLLWAAKLHQFGPAGETELTCSECHALIGFNLLENFTLDAAQEAAPRVSFDGVMYELRLPTLGDLAAKRLPEAVQPEAPWHDPAFRAAAAEALDAADPAMDVIFDISCPDCGHVTERVFDAGTLIWTDVQLLSEARLTEVALLARAFGWSEAETLALAPARRARYLEMVG